MSHISVWSQVKITCLETFRRVCENNKAKFTALKEGETAKMFGSQTAKGVAYFELEDWNYPLVISDKGEIQYDNFMADPRTSMQTFGKLLQAYNREIIYHDIDFSKYSVEETINDQGEIEMTLTEY